MGNIQDQEVHITKHKRRRAIHEAQIFEEWNVNIESKRDLSKILSREPVLYSLKYNRLYNRRITQIK